jgi:hypothetical protein
MAKKLKIDQVEEKVDDRKQISKIIDQLSSKTKDEKRKDALKFGETPQQS